MVICWYTLCLLSEWKIIRRLFHILTTKMLTLFLLFLFPFYLYKYFQIFSKDIFHFKGKVTKKEKQGKPERERPSNCCFPVQTTLTHRAGIIWIQEPWASFKSQHECRSPNTEANLCCSPRPLAGSQIESGTAINGIDHLTCYTTGMSP